MVPNSRGPVLAAPQSSSCTALPLLLRARTDTDGEVGAKHVTFTFLSVLIGSLPGHVTRGAAAAVTSKARAGGCRLLPVVPAAGHTVVLLLRVGQR